MDNMKLYQYTESFQNLINWMDEQEEVNYEDMKDTLDAIKLPAKEKIANTGRVIRKKQDDLLILAEHKKRIEKAIKDNKKQTENLKEYLLFHMNQLELKKVDEADITVSVRNNAGKLIITNEEKMPKEFVKEIVETKIDKDGFKKYYKTLSDEEKEAVDFAFMEENKSINIK